MRRPARRRRCRIRTKVNRRQIKGGPGVSMKTAVMILALGVLCYAPIVAQQSGGTLRGRIVDSTGAAIVGAEVRVLNRDTGASTAGRTNESGNYTVPYLLPGTYDLTVEFSGFKKSE